MRMPLVNYILLADDDKDHAVLFGRILNRVDPTKTLITVYDGQQLLDFLQQFQPQILFLDLNMPCKNGVDCLLEIRSNPKYNDLRIIVYSSSLHMQDISKCYSYKADLYLVKPFDTEHLSNALHTILKPDWQSELSGYHYFINNRFVPFTTPAWKRVIEII